MRMHFRQAERPNILRAISTCRLELHALCAKDGGSPELLQQRLAQLHLDKNEIKRAHPGVARDLEKVCALCTTEVKCSRDFDRTSDPAGWTDYCPNADTLQQLQQEVTHKNVA